MNGGDLANALSDNGLNFLTGLLSTLDGSVVASAINGNPGAVSFLADLIAYLNPYFVESLINSSSDTGAIKNLITSIQTYYAHSNDLFINLLVQFIVGQVGDLQIKGARVYIPPDKPTGPPT
jgi:hypothetical protein